MTIEISFKAIMDFFGYIPKFFARKKATAALKKDIRDILSGKPPPPDFQDVISNTEKHVGTTNEYVRCAKRMNRARKAGMNRRQAATKPQGKNTIKKTLSAAALKNTTNKKLKRT